MRDEYLRQPTNYNARENFEKSADSQVGCSDWLACLSLQYTSPLSKLGTLYPHKRAAIRWVGELFLRRIYLRTHRKATVLRI